MATFARYSCERCIGLRVWNAATRVHPSRSNSARVSAGVMKSGPYCALNPPSESTVTGPARFTSPCFITICTPGCAGSVVLNTDMHSCALSMRYFSVTFITASTAPSSGSVSATSAPSAIGPAPAASVESVIGIGQNRPAAVRIPSHTPCQSAWVMKPSSGVKPPRPSMTRSPFSRELTRSLGRDCARFSSCAARCGFACRGFRPRPPCGLTRPGMAFPPHVTRCPTLACARAVLPENG